MVKANDLIKQQREREEKKKETYKKILDRIEKICFYICRINCIFFINYWL